MSHYLSVSVLRYFLAVLVGACAIGVAPAQASPIGTAFRSSAAFELVQRDSTTGQLRQTTLNPETNRWTAWQARGGDAVAPQSDIAAVARSTDSLDVFYISTAQQLRRRSWTVAGGWAAPVTVSTAAVNGGPGVLKVAGGSVLLTARSAADGTLVRHVWNPATGATTTTTSTWYLAPWTAAGLRASGSTIYYYGVGRNTTTGIDNRLQAARDPANGTGVLTTPTTFHASTVSGTPTVQSLGGVINYVTTGNPTGGVKRFTQFPGSSVTSITWSSTPPGAPTTAPAVGPYTYVTDFFAAGPDSTSIAQYWGGQPWQRWQTIRPNESAQPGLGGMASSTPGQLRYFGRTDGDPTWISWFSPANTPPANRTWMQANTWRTMLSSGDGNPTSWYRGGMMYAHLYTIDPKDALCHPDWVMRDSAGGELYAQDGSNPHDLVAGNIYNPKYRQYRIGRLKAWLTAAGTNFTGLWLDNVNLEVGGSGLVKQVYNNNWNATLVGRLTGVPSGNPAQYPVPFVAPGTGTTKADGCTTIAGGAQQTETSWSTAVAAMVSELKAALPAGKELLINTPWFQTQRDVESYQFIKDANDRPLGGLPTAAGQQVVAAADHVNFESSFWINSEFSGYGPGGALVGASGNYSSLDSIFRWMDAVHDRGKGIIAESNVDGQYSDFADAPPAVLAAGTVKERIREFNLAGHLLTQTPRDGLGEYDRTNVNWPVSTGSGGSSLFGLNVGLPTATPQGATSARPSDPTARGVVMVGSGGNRLWVRAFTYAAGIKLYVLLSEPSYDPAAPQAGKGTAGGAVSYTLPAPDCTNLTRAAGAQPSYASLSADGAVATLLPRSAMIVRCSSGSLE